MKPLSIPVRVVGPGSQPEEEELQYLDLPRQMSTFQMPSAPQQASAEALAESIEVLAEFLDALGPWDPASKAPGPRLDVTGVSPPALAITNEMLGEGEVSIQVSGTRRLRIQESVFTGVWRVVELAADGQLAADWIEAGPVPRVVIDSALEMAASAPALVNLPSGAMNSPALLQEIQGRMHDWRPSTPAHVINLTLFPMSPDDHQVLERALPVGPVAMISRGFGHCRISSTLARNVWRVQYFNSMNTLILDTIEIVDVPEVAIAAPEDLADSRARLGELITWMGESSTA
ncbi:MAG TPA: hydrogenase expression/formation protein [Casimicrobiaceae bacterium]|nr:hydrogenase expression/formation protein [Casimicrobiaceae bacterium]